MAYVEATMLILSLRQCKQTPGGHRCQTLKVPSARECQNGELETVSWLCQTLGRTFTSDIGCGLCSSVILGALNVQKLCGLQPTRHCIQACLKLNILWVSILQFILQVKVGQVSKECHA